MPPVKCFFVKPSTRVNIYFRRYADGQCPRGSYHNASMLSETIDVPVPGNGNETDERLICKPAPDEKRHFFPTKCDSCDFLFPDDATYQIFTERLYANEETGESFTLRDLPPGAMYYADWMLVENSNHFRGPDGHCLVVVTPDNHPWMIDSRANNCTLPDDDVHKCWVRHGAAPAITVDKNGVTCSAGAGSIQTSKWHGFLRNGFLEQC